MGWDKGVVYGGEGWRLGMGRYEEKEVYKFVDVRM